MNKVIVKFLAAAVSLLSLAHSANATELTPAVERLDNETPQRVLFIGNSYLYYNDSLHNHVEWIGDEIGPHAAGDYQYKSATIGGARLSHHPVGKLLKPGRLDIDEPFELVILQGGSRETLTPEGRAEFRDTALRLNKKIRATGAEVALYMTHAHVEPDDRYQPDAIDTIAPAYVSVGNELGALVLPVGLAFERAYEQRPDIVLHQTYDGSHPSLLGTYLAACVVYQSIYDTSPVGIDYDYFGAVDKDDAAFLQKVADETVREFFGRD